MSLNGLDTTEVQEAYQSAIAEAGGWFLLKYISRDSVDLLGKGKHGVSEARNALAAYAEASPLYGLLMYRRRRILIKYIPEGTSRLLQARTSVHLQDVLERYSPYETLLELTNGDALNDTALAASFHLHTASPSPSAGRLDELREEEEDDATLGDSSAANTSSATLSGAQRYRADRGIGKRAQRPTTSLHSLNPTTGSAVLSPSSPAKSPVLRLPSPTEPDIRAVTPVEPPTSLAANEEPDQPTITAPDIPADVPRAAESPASESDTIRPAISSTEESDSVAVQSEPHSVSESPQHQVTEFPPRRQSLSAISLMRSQSMDEDPYDFSQYDALFKPKVKLGPRPINASEKAKRSTAPRVAAVPGNLKTAPRKQEPSRPQSQGQPYMPRSATAPSALESAAPSVLPKMPEIPVYIPRPMSRGSIRSAPSHKAGPMSADKIRLMKAVELRRKQMRKSQGSMFNAIDEEGAEVSEMPKTSTQVDVKQETLPVPEPQMHSKPESEQEPEQSSTDDESQHQSSKADSGIELRYGTPDTQRTEETSDETHEPAILIRAFDERDPEAHGSGTATILIDPSTSVDNDNHEDVQADAVSTTASQTPTERPPVSEHGSDGMVKAPETLLADDSRSRASFTESVVASTTQEEGETGEAVIDQGQDKSSSPHKRSNSDVAKRRRGIVEPLSLDTTTGNPDDEDVDSDDDDFFEELHSATVQEAKPITVARSPIALSFQARRPSAETMNSVKSLKAATAPPSEASEYEARSLFLGSSPTSVQASEKQDSASAGRARNVSSGISRRIQALTELSVREPSGSIPSSPDASPGGFGKSSRRTPPASRPSSYRRQSRNSAANTPTSATPTEENRPTWSLQHDPVTNRNTVSVSTRIARPGVPTPTSMRSVAIPESSSVDEVMHATTPPAIEIDPPLSPGHSTKSSDSRSLHSRGGRFLMERQNLTPALDDFPPPPPNTRIISTMSLGVRDENIAPKEGSKASRFFKRMSGLAGPRRKSGTQSPPASRSPVKLKSQSTLTIPQDARPVNVVTARSDTPPAAVVGDLNVQFPDSLLWKRRIVTIDDYGVLQFAIAQAMDIHRGVAMKRYSLTDFKAPFVPDLDQQELPHSVVLEFDDGTALQVACEDAMTQRQVLSLLNTYWRAYLDNMMDG